MKRTPMKTLRIGFIPLVDAAIAIAAVECDFAEREDLKIELVREVSWANIRDKLASEIFDAAHMLAPLAVATSLGIGHLKAPLAVPFGLNANGNCITVSSSLYRLIEDVLGHAPVGPVESASAMRIITERRKQMGAPPLSFGVVFPFSIHAILIRHWLELGGVDIENCVQFVVVPPPFMVENLSSGVIEGYCVGEPWNSRAVENGVGCILVFGSDLNRFAPDKVLAMRESLTRENTGAVGKLLRAYKAAALWCGDPANRGNLAQILSKPEYLNVAPKTVLNALNGTLPVNRTENRRDANFLTLGDALVNYPDPRRASWLYAQIRRSRGEAVTAAEERAAAAVYRPDLYEAALGAGPDLAELDPVALNFGASMPEPAGR
ncbi:MAG: CmpA/NrtA family ABC transporter substrate-binding protein [Pseudomonadota bacterium]